MADAAMEVVKQIKNDYMQHRMLGKLADEATMLALKKIQLQWEE